jgi:hypothetical protein
MVERAVEDLELESLAAAPPDSDPPFLSNLAPAASATGIVRGTQIAFRLDDLGDGVSLPTVIVSINSGAGFVTAYSASAFANGYSGVATPAGVAGFDFLITPPALLPELTVVSVRVQAVDLSPLANALDQTYVFTTRDDTAPVISLRSPAAGTLDVAPASTVSFRALDTGGVGVAQATIQVTITQGGVPSAAVVNGALQAPWNGVGSGITPSGNGFDVAMVRTGGLTDEVTILVALTVADLDGNVRVDSWSFSTVTPLVPPSGAVEANSDGGEMLSIELGLPDGEYYVDVGVDPDTAAVRAYGGRSGFGARALSVDGVLTFTVPRLAPAADYRARVTPVGGGASSLTAPLFHARRRPLFASTYGLRAALPGNRWAIGPIKPESEVVS